MSFFDRLLGREPERPVYGTPDDTRDSSHRDRTPAATGTDDAAIERYRYLLRTAPPDAIEQAHAEAFAQLTPPQRQQVLTRLGSQVPEAERARSAEPQALARMATRAEMRRPGTLERSFGGGAVGGIGGSGGGIGMGGLIAGGLLASVAGAFVGTAIADAMFDPSDTDQDGDPGDDSADGGDSDDRSSDSADSGGSADSGSGFDSAGGSGDFGGGDFGDFGGGDF